MQLLDLGVGVRRRQPLVQPEAGRLRGDPRAAWLQRDELRQAISLAVDRQLFADTVFLGAGVPVYGPDDAGEQEVVLRTTCRRRRTIRPRAKAAARVDRPDDRNGDGCSRTRRSPARSRCSRRKGGTTLERGAAVIRDELKKIGIDGRRRARSRATRSIQRFLSGDSTTRSISASLPPTPIRR